MKLQDEKHITVLFTVVMVCIFLSLGVKGSVECVKRLLTYRASRALHDIVLKKLTDRNVAVVPRIRIAYHRVLEEIAAHIRICAHALGHVELLCDESREIGIVQGIVRGEMLLKREVLHCVFERALLRAAVGLTVKYYLKVVDLVKPIRRNIVNVEVLLKHRDIVRTPGEEGKILTAPLLEALRRLGQRRADVDLLLSYAAELGDVSVKLLKMLRLDDDLIRTADIHIGIHFYGAYLYDLTAQTAGKPALYGKSLLRISLIPLEVKRYIIHIFVLFFGHSI